MSPPPAAGLPPYSSSSTPRFFPAPAPPYASSPHGPPPSAAAAAAAAAAPPALPNGGTPTQRKTVRFQTDGDDGVLLRRSKAASLPTSPAALRERHGVSYFDSGATTSSSSSSSSSSGGGGSNSSSATITPAAAAAAGLATSAGGPHSGGSLGYDGHDVDRANHSSNTTTTTTTDDTPVARPTLLQPRVAVVLGLPSLWHLPLFACRSLSVCPAIWWSLGIFIRLLAQLHALAVARSEGAAGFGVGVGVGALAGAGGASCGPNHAGGSGGVGGGLGDGIAGRACLAERTGGLSLESRLKLTETALAMIWCGASAYLSFFFTDCLMSRWLLNYTPQATIVRLLAINALNGYLTSWVIYLMGSGSDSRLLLPAWVAIAAILTGLYHVTQRKINIRKETSISISVFSGASFISMVSLLAQLYWGRPEYVDVPVVVLARRVCTETARIAGNLFDIGNITIDL